jgi:hypothetical protein
MMWWLGYVSLITSGESVVCVTKRSWSCVGSILNWQKQKQKRTSVFKDKSATIKTRDVIIKEAGLFTDLLPDTCNIRRVYVSVVRVFS